MQTTTRFIKKSLPLTVMLTALFCVSPAQAQEQTSFNDIYRTGAPTQIQNEPELSNILTNFVYTDVQKHVSFTPAEQEFLTLAILTALGTPQEIPAHVQGALKAALLQSRFMRPSCTLRPMSAIRAVRLHCSLCTRPSKKLA